MSAGEEEATLSLPSIAIVAVLGYIIYKYFIAKSSDPSTSSSGNGLRFTAPQVEQIAQMFPQLDRRDIMWDLHRNRGNVQGTTERALQRGRLDPAPPSFQPVLPAASFASTPLSAVAGKSSKPVPDLITRYNLQSRVTSAKGKEKEEEEPQQSPSSGWAGTKEQRQTILQKRRDEMILAARRKMQERDLQPHESSA